MKKEEVVKDDRGDKIITQLRQVCRGTELSADTHSVIGRNNKPSKCQA